MPAKLDEVKAAVVDLQETNAAIGRMRGNPDLRVWLPRKRGLQREQLLMHNGRLSRAHQFLASLQVSAEHLGEDN